jgi:23S rRNA (guanine745-N1)-methyltransferase
VLNDVVHHLVCPVCGSGLRPADGALRCAAGHAFDIARQGYVNLLPGDARPDTADTAEMARSREAFLGAGHFDGLARLLADLVHDAVRHVLRNVPRDAEDGGSPCVLDAGAGTGYYLAATLNRTPGATGIAVDLSKHALRRAARAHPLMGAIAWDLWRPLPIRDRSMAVILNVFAPRNGTEFRRVLMDDGTLCVVTPTARHLGTLVGPLGLLSVDERKAERVGGSLGGLFTLEAHHVHETELLLGHDEVETLVRMGPSSWHVSPERLRSGLAALPDPVAVPASFDLSTFRPT